jgi:branched-chain amino acid transport system ATP-binding protein
MCTSPRVICLDEPAAGLNPSETADLAELIKRLRSVHGVTVMVIEHDMGLVMDISDHVVVLDHGQVIASGTPNSVAENPAVVAAYLGAPEEVAA